MQTFLPYADFRKSAKVLDAKRLGKQRVEAQQILNAMKRKSGGWVNHPATKMWREFSEALVVYRNECILEWVRRGYRNTMEIIAVEAACIVFPNWLGDERIHASHRSNLLRKDPVYYSQFNWKEKNDMPYYWPVV